MTRIAVAQIPVRAGGADASLELTVGAIVAAAERGAELVVMPELANSGYVFADAAEASSAAEPLDGCSVAAWAEVSEQQSLVLAAGLCERADDGRLYNSAVVLDRGRLSGVYRKAHLWGRESEFFTPGSGPPLVVDTSVGRVGVMICYDLEFPEWTRMAALAGAEVLAVPTNWPLAPRPAGERPAEVLKAQAAAATNRVVVAVADRCGREREVDWVGGSMILDPDGYPVVGPSLTDAPSVLSADVDLLLSRDKRYGEHNDVIADRRLDLYDPSMIPSASRESAT